MTEQHSPSSESPLHWTDLLLAHPALTSEYILEVADGRWECRCGNTHDWEGFDTCDESGGVVESVLGPWDGSLYLCNRCYRVINGDTLVVLGSATESIIEANEEYRWMPQ